VLPTSIKAEPSAYGAKFGVMRVSLNWSFVLLSVRV